MKKFISKFSIIIVVVFIVTSLLSGVVSGASAEKVKVIITFNTQPGQAEKALVRAFGGEIKHEYTIIPGFAATMPVAALKGLANNPKIDSITEDVQIHALGELEDTWGVGQIGADAVQAGGNTGAGVKVAILDSGINYNHQDLDDNYAGGYDFVNNDSDPMDDHWHGTHVAGTVAAEANGFGAIGVAPDVELYALKVLDNTGTGNFGDVIAALQWCIDNGIQVTNNSYGSSVDPGPAVENAFIAANAAGIINISSAGNEGNRPGKGDNVGYPGAYASVVAVAATDSRDVRAKFSSTGPDVEISAPGVSIYSTYINDGSYAWADGTSMASPHIAGVAALMIKAGITGPDNIRAAMQATAIDLGDPGWDTKYGFGLVDAVAAVGGTTPVNNAPVVSIDSPTDGSSYDSGSSVTFTGTADDIEDGNLNSAIVWTSDLDGPLGTGVSVSAVLTDGTHTVTAEVTDSGGESDNASIEVVVGDEPVPGDTLSVSDITYSTSGGRGGTAHLEIDIGLEDETNTPVAGAVITIELYLNGSLYATKTGTTDSVGIASYKVPGAPSGTYSLTVVSVTVSGYSWDGLTPENEFPK